MGEVRAGPARPRDERAIRHNVALTVTEADDLLRRLHQWDVMQSTGDGPYWQGEIRRVRGLLAEWRVESD